MTGRQAIIKALYESPRPLALHEIPVVGINQAAASARLRELARDGIVVGTRRPGTAYKEWAMAPTDLIIPVVIP